jgi:hypothetical protein
MEPVAPHSVNAADAEMEPAVSHGVDAHGDVDMELSESHSVNALDTEMGNGASAPLLEREVQPPTLDDDINHEMEDALVVDSAPTASPAVEQDDSRMVDGAPIAPTAVEQDDMMRDIEGTESFDYAASHEVVMTNPAFTAAAAGQDVVMTEQAPAVPEVASGMDINEDEQMDIPSHSSPSTEVTVPTVVPASPAVPSMSSFTFTIGSSLTTADDAMNEDAPGLVHASTPAAVSAAVNAVVESASGGAAMASPAMSLSSTNPGTPLRPTLEPTRGLSPGPAKAPVTPTKETASPAAPKLDKRFIISNSPTRPLCKILSAQPESRPAPNLKLQPRKKELYTEGYEDNDGYQHGVRWDLRGYPDLDGDALRRTEQRMLEAAEEASKDWPSRQAGIDEQWAMDVAVRKAREKREFEAKKKKDIENYKKRQQEKKNNPTACVFGKFLSPGVCLFSSALKPNLYSPLIFWFFILSYLNFTLFTHPPGKFY